MIDVPSIKQLSRESFPDQTEWIDPLLYAINEQADLIVALATQLNQQGGLVELDIDIPGTYGDAFPKLVGNPLPMRARAVYAAGIFERTNVSATKTSATRAVFVEWENSADSSGALKIKIKNVSGLEVSTNYRITLKVEA